MKRLTVTSALLLIFALIPYQAAGAHSPSDSLITRTIVTYFEAVQNKDLGSVAGLMATMDQKTLQVYQATFRATNQRIMDYKVKKILKYQTKALAWVWSQWQITSTATGEGFTATNENAFLLEKRGNLWKIARILPAQNLDLLIKNYFFKKEMPSGWKIGETQETRGGEAATDHSQSREGAYNTAEGGENFLELEYDTDRPGMDYRNFDLPSNDPMLCQRACFQDPRCKAWTFVKPNTIQGPHPRCWLKNAVPPARHATCCVSGVKENSNVQGNKRKPSSPFQDSPYTEPWFHNWRVVKIIKDPSGTIGKIYNSNQQFGWKKPVIRIGDAMPPPGAWGAALYLHPVSSQEPTVLHGTYRVNSANQAIFFRVAGNANGDWLMVVKIDGIKRLEKRIDGRKWYDLKVPVGEYIGQEISVDLYVKANGWFYEYAFIDEIRLVNN